MSSIPNAGIVTEPLLPQDESLWEEYIKDHPLASSYHSLLWRNLFQSTFHYRPCHLIAKRKNKVVGALPLFRVPSFRGPLLVSVPFRDRGDILFDSEEILQELIKKAKQLTHELKCRLLLIKSLSDLSDILNGEKQFSVSHNWIRSFLVLPSEPEVLWTGLSDKTRNMIRQGERAGLTFHSSVETPRDVEACISLLRKTQHRLGVPPFPKSFHQNLISRLTEHEKGTLCAIRHDGKTVATALLLIHRDSVVYAYAGSLEDVWNLRINDFLVWNCLRLAIERGASSFDFGSDSCHQKGLLFFKKKWLAEQKPLNYYFYMPKGNAGDLCAWRDNSQGLYPFLRGFVKRLPTPLYNLTGYLTRFFG